MKRSFLRVLVAVAALLVAVPAVCGALAWWFEGGPGFRRQCDRLAAIAAIRPGMTVADLGAVCGRVAVLIAARLGSSGRLYATELYEARLGEIKQTAAAEGLTNVTAVQAGVNTTRLPPGCGDVIYLRRVYHHLSDPPAIAAAIYSSLRPGGRLVVIDMLTPNWLPRS